MLASSPPPFSFFAKPKTTSLLPQPVAVTTRVVTVQRLVTEKEASPAPVDQPRPPAPLKRKRTEKDALQRVKRSRSNSVASSISSSTTLVDATPPPPRPRARTRPQRDSDTASSSSASPSRASTRTRNSPPTSDVLYRSSRSRSVSVLRAPEEPIPRDCHVDENATQEDGFLSSEMVVRDLMRAYRAYFRNPNNPSDASFEPHPTEYPVAELEFPNSGACERFILLAPKDKDHYAPILDLERTLYCMLECYLTPAQRSLFGTLPTDFASPDDATPDKVDLLRALRRAHLRLDGPLYVTTVKEINKLLRTLKYPLLPADAFAPALPNAFTAVVRSWPDIPRKVVLRLIEETYQRTVGPRTDELKRYEAFSSAVYGELMPSLVAAIVERTCLRPGMLLMDLGSGVGNVVLQAALQSGCNAFGVEVMKGPSALARDQRQQMIMRARMWGVNMGDVELEEGDMLESKRVNELMSKADVVLVNNKVFHEPLNEAIRPKFLDLKEGAIVVSLNPFVSSVNARVTERNVDDISAIFDVTEHEYNSMDVSWGSSTGSYYLHRVDRTGYAEIRAKFEQQAAARSTRSRR
ncbi:DOT1-domain-containing protein [Artomyces pyxidatus]|uniref:DOT1-domain-containing protein n=1 Tax=Artomyces pyxidatus TaxID=48021 RepID=A0ACB8SLM8_9AGAM|nr:DOT1-domain-containing protein [Artomyces pyxidatus]